MNNSIDHVKVLWMVLGSVRQAKNARGVGQLRKLQLSCGVAHSVKELRPCDARGKVSHEMAQVALNEEGVHGPKLVLGIGTGNVDKYGHAAVGQRIKQALGCFRVARRHDAKLRTAV